VVAAGNKKAASKSCFFTVIGSRSY